MKRITTIAALIFMSFATQQAIADEGFLPCIPLSEKLSICTNIEGLGVSFIDATPTAAMGIARLQSHDDLLFIWAAYWDVDISLDEYAKTQAQAVADNMPEHQLQKPNSVVIKGYSGIRYDILPITENGVGLGPQSLLFLDTGAGFAILNGTGGSDSTSIGDIHLGAESVTRILKVNK